MTNLRQFFPVLLLLGAVVTGWCAETPAAAPTAAVRVVSQTVGTDELLLALAAPEQVAALSHLARDPAFSAVPEEARRYPQLNVGGDAESILRYAPTLVLFANYSRAELAVQIRRAGVRVLIFDRYDTLDDAYANLRLLARELGAEAKAERLIADCQARMKNLAVQLRHVKPVRVIAPSPYGMIPGRDSTFQDLCDHAAAENLADTLGHLVGHAVPPSEQMLTWPVDYVVVAGTDLESALAPYRTIPPYEYMPAVREGRAVLLKPHLLSCVSHYRIDGYEMLARALHPEAFRACFQIQPRLRDGRTWLAQGGPRRGGPRPMLLGTTQGQPGSPGTRRAGTEQVSRGVELAEQGFNPAPASPPSAKPTASPAQAWLNLETRPQ